MSSSDTFFDTPARTPAAVRRAQVLAVAQQAIVGEMLDGLSLPAALVNEDREVVAGNAHLAQLAGCAASDLIGQRIGELLSCIHAYETPHGCGTTEACAVCGAAQALRDSRLHRRVASSDCSITRSLEGLEPVTAAVTSTPLLIGAYPVTLIVLRDTSDQQRRRVLERMFFHDALNAAGGLQGLMETWPDLSPEEAVSMAPAAAHLAAQLVDEIQAHRDLLAAENGSLVASLSHVDVAGLLEDLRMLYAAHDIARGKHLVVRYEPGAPAMQTDPVLLRRVLGNLVKNALEASRNGDTVTVTHEHGAPTARFVVHNATSIPPPARLRVFQRAFTTKGAGRGLGTYGARLVTERHLGGTLTFASDEESGTSFCVALPSDAGA